MTNHDELERRAEIELEKLGVAEDMGWGMAGGLRRHFNLSKME